MTITNQDYKLKVVENMQTYGGSFVQTLAQLILRADGANLQKIQATWPEYINQYAPEKWSR